jgi:hypothetical protein
MTLTRLERRWAQAAMVAIFPGSVEAGLAGIGVMQIDGFLREVMRTLPFRAALGVRLAVWLVAVAPWFLLRRFVTIAGLGPAERERVISLLVASRWYAVRSLALLLKAIGALLYAADDRVRRHMAPPRPRLAQLRVRAPA